MSVLRCAKNVNSTLSIRRASILGSGGIQDEGNFRKERFLIIGRFSAVAVTATGAREIELTTQVPNLSQQVPRLLRDTLLDIVHPFPWIRVLLGETTNNRLQAHAVTARHEFKFVPVDGN
jgi:hypothetical protein